MYSDQIKEEIRARIDFPSLVAKSTELKRWPNGVGAVPAFCPFHDNSNSPALGVYADHATCFGACGQTWDVFGWLMRRDNLTFPDALRAAADLAGVVLPETSPEQHQRAERQQRQQDVLTAAMGFYRRQLVQTRARSGSALHYAKDRGWRLRTIGRAFLGYAPDDLPGFMAWLSESGISPEQAIDAGLLAKGSGRVYLRFRDRLMFPILRGGRCAFFTARDLSGRPDVPKWLHLSTDGESRPIYGQIIGSGPLVLVESPADQLTLQQLGIESAAIMGTTLPDGVLSVLRRRRPLTIMLDDDAAGRGGMHKLGRAIGPTVRIAVLPGQDANALLQRVGSGEASSQIRQVIGQASSYVEFLARNYGQAGDLERETLLERFLDAVAALEPRDFAILRDRLAELSGLGLRTLRELLKTHTPAAMDDEHSPTLTNRYGIVSGCICRLGDSGPQPLADFSAQIDLELRLDNGDEITTEYQIIGATESGRRLPVARVPAGTYAEMNWIDEQWGVSAVIAAGQKVNVATAIKLLSKGAETRHIYTHTGWREIDGKHVFLNCGGAVGYTGHDAITVELGRELERYRLPGKPEDPAEAFCTSLQFLDVADRSLTIPLWSAMFQAPLIPFLAPRMVIWVYGPTNTYKSTTVLLAMRHFGDFVTEGDAVSWTSTGNAIELAGYMLKDCPMVVDDFAHQPNHYQQRKLQQSAERLIRATGNESGRWRMDAKSQRHRSTTAIRSLVISTGETLPSVAPSAHARILPLRFTGGSVDLNRLSAAQTLADRYPHAMSGYMLWISEHWGELETWIQNYFLERRSEARQASQQRTARLTDVICRNYTAVSTAMRYGQSIGAISEAQANLIRGEAWANLMDLASRQDDEVKQEDPIKRFLRTLLELIDAQRAWLCPVGLDPDIEVSAKPYQAEKIGWQDERHYWLIYDVTYGLVQRYASQTGYPLTFSPKEIKERLFEAGVLIKSDQERWQTRLNTAPGRPWCTLLDKEKIFFLLE